MSLGLIQPGASVALRHPKTGAIIGPLYVRKNGTAVWPVLGAASDDPDDPAFTGDGGSGGAAIDDDEDEEDEEDEEEKPKPKAKPKPKSSDDDDEDDDDDPRILKASRQAKRYRLELRESQQKNAELEQRLKAIENKDKPADQVASSELNDAKGKVETLTAQNRQLANQLAFFSTPLGIDWADSSDAFALAEREGLFEDAVDEDGNVDKRELRRGLKDLAKRKPHLVKSQETPKGSSSKGKADEDEDDEEEPRSPRTMNGSRRGNKGTTPTRAELAKKFPILRSR